jgi:hypothetical protein
VGEVSLLPLPIDYLGGRDGKGRVALLLQVVKEAQGHLVQPVVGRLVVVFVKERGTILQLIQDGVAEPKAQGYPVRQLGGSPLERGMEGLPDGPQVSHPEEGDPFLQGQATEGVAVKCRQVLGTN